MVKVYLKINSWLLVSENKSMNKSRDMDLTNESGAEQEMEEVNEIATGT